MSDDLFNIPLRTIDGAEASLGAYRGKVLLIVNVASKCGLTPQYEGLEKLYEDLGAKGLEVLGFPANDFGGQEPGSDAEIADFCATNYAVSFPLFSKIAVSGPQKHPIYQALTTARPDAVADGPFRERLKGYGMTPAEGGEVLWNFEKFLVGRDGTVLSRFAPDVAADDPRLIEAIDAALAA